MGVEAKPLSACTLSGVHDVSASNAGGAVYVEGVPRRVRTPSG
jgi:hypothetical protein